MSIWLDPGAWLFEVILPNWFYILGTIAAFYVIRILRRAAR